MGKKKKQDDPDRKFQLPPAKDTKEILTRIRGADDLLYPFHRISDVKDILEALKKLPENITPLRYLAIRGIRAREETELLKYAERGKPFIEGSKKPRNDALNREIEKTYLKLRGKGNGPTAREILNALPVFPKGKVIQEIDEYDCIYWKNTRRGKEKQTGFRSFENRLTRIKKSHKK